MTKLTLPVTLDEYEALARDSLTSATYGYFRSGADSEMTLRRNEEAYTK
jgi:(S)-2-hydroxy-acid oxidase